MAIRINVNGNLGTEKDLLLSPLDLGFVFGASVYETLRTYRGRPFLLERHLTRLRESAASLGIPLDLNDQQIMDRIEKTLTAASNPESYVRLIVSAGGVAVVGVVRNHPKSVSPRIKTSNLLNNMFALREAHARGAEEAVMLSYRGEVAEGSQTNVFLVKDRVVKTPTVDVGILAGITRELVLRLTAEQGFETKESVISPEELLHADEVFITSSTREVVPVVEVDDTRIGDGRPGPVTLALLAAYRERVGSSGTS